MILIKYSQCSAIIHYCGYISYKINYVYFFILEYTPINACISQSLTCNFLFQKNCPNINLWCAIVCVK